MAKLNNLFHLMLLLFFIASMPCHATPRSAKQTHANSVEFGNIKTTNLMYTAETIDDAFVQIEPDYSIAIGQNTASTNSSFVWSSTGDSYSNRANGTFNVNPIGGAYGFYIGTNTLASLIVGGTNLMTTINGDAGAITILGDGNSGGSGIITITGTNGNFTINADTSGFSGDVSAQHKPGKIIDDIEDSTYTILLDRGEQYFPPISSNNVTLNITQANEDTIGSLVIYITEDYEHNGIYKLDETGLIGVPSTKFWESSTKSKKSTWKFEFETYPGTTNWYYMKAVEFVMIPK